MNNIRTIRYALAALAALALLGALAACGGSDAATAAGEPERKLVLTNWQPAALVLGQQDFTTADHNSPGANTYSGFTVGQPAWVGGRLYVPDSAWNRVLVYHSFPTQDNQGADWALGQADFTGVAADRGGAPSAASTLNGPLCVAADGTHFLVMCLGDYRILVYDGAPAVFDGAAGCVAGQADFAGNGRDVAAGRFWALGGATLAGGRLIVSDLGNNRVLVWNTVPATNGTPADLVLGQSSFTRSTGNDDDQDGSPDASPSARTLRYPQGVWSDGTRLAVADSGNNRVLVWNTFPSSSFTPADVVIGQPAMSSSNVAAGATGMQYPYFIGGRAGQLFVADKGNNRVLVFDTIPTANGAAADAVLGQPDFAQTAANNGGQSARSLAFPVGVLAIDGKLLVTDHDNHRVLVYQSN